MKGDTISHNELMLELSKKTGKPLKALKEVYDAYAQLVTAACASGRRVVLKDIGTLKVMPTPARVGRNVVKGEPIDIPASKRLKLVVCKSLKATITQ